MPRRNIYFKDKIDRQIKDKVEIELQRGATQSEVNHSSMVNELCRLGLMVHDSKEEGSGFDLDGFRRDLIKKVSGSREGIMILIALLSEMYVLLKGPEAMLNVEEILNHNITAINDAEDNAENQHFRKDE